MVPIRPVPRLKTRAFKATELIKVSPAPPPDVPPLMVGDRCRLNSGGPVMLVVDFGMDHVVTAWPGHERAFLRATVRRAA